MEERKKILALVAEGKLTAEQADLLFDALADKSKSKTDGKMAWDKATAELKSIGSQMSNVLMQSFSELRRGLETNLPNLSFGDHVSTSSEHEFTGDIRTLLLESGNARIRVERWSQPTVRLYVQADVRAEEQEAARAILGSAVQTSEANDEVSIRFVNRSEGSRVFNGRIDLYVPDHVESVSIETRNGGIFVHHAALKSLRVETVNGKIHVEDASAHSINLTTQNGGIHLIHSISSVAKDIFAQTRNGAITVRGIDPEMPVYGQAKSTAGTVTIANPKYTAVYEDTSRKNACTFGTSESVAPGDDGVSVYLESRNGSINIQ